MEATEKIYCMGNPCGSNDAATMAALMNNNNFNNNPFIYLVFMMFANRLWGNGFGGENTANFTSQLDSIRSQMSDNQNSTLLMDAVKGNNQAISQLASNLNCDFNALNGAINDARMGIQNVAGQVGYSAEKVINAINLGDANMMSKFQDCCCGVKTEVQRMGYENQLANCQQTNTIVGAINNQSYGMLDRMRDLGNGIAQGFASTAYDTQRQTCDIINAINASQQKTSDLLNGHWNDELAGKLQDAKFEVSQLKQNQYIAGLLSKGCGCGC